MTARLHIETPLIESRALSARAGRTVWLKLECVQPSGSFKIRGIGHACQEYRRRGAQRFISSSGGNAGLAVAYAGRRLSVPVTVVVPETTSARAKELISAEQADVVVHGASWQEANAHAQSMLSERDAFLHPFDDRLIWEGHASLVDEVARSGLKPDAVVLSVGGGGLLCGVAEGLRRNDWSTVAVVAAETRGADSYAQSVLAGRRVELAEISSIATSLGARQVCQQAFDLAARHPIRNAVVSDRHAVSACKAFIDDHRLLVEPACGAALALVYDAFAIPAEYETLLIVVCGGVTTTQQQLESWYAQLAGAPVT